MAGPYHALASSTRAGRPGGKENAVELGIAAVTFAGGS